MENTAIEIVKLLSDWSKKYPRDRVYSFHKIDMDKELIEIEEKAKKFINENPELLK